MNLEENCQVPASGHAEHRSSPRFAVAEAASLLLAAHSSTHTCSVVDLSLGGCRLRTRERLPARVPARVEVNFRINGIAFRFSGLVQWTDGQSLLGVRFIDVTSRRQDELAEVLGEVQVDHAAKQLAGARQSKPAGEQPKIAEQHIRPVEDRPPTALPRRERRQQGREPVDTSATIHLIKTGSRIVGRIVDLSMNGCRIRTENPFPVGIYTRVETEFRAHGLAFRLGGVIQAVHDHDRLNIGVRFLDLSERKELIQEIAESRRG